MTERIFRFPRLLVSSVRVREVADTGLHMADEKLNACFVDFEDFHGLFASILRFIDVNT